MVCSLPVDPLRGSQLMVYSVALRVVLVAAMAVGNGGQGWNKTLKYSSLLFLLLILLFFVKRFFQDSFDESGPRFLSDFDFFSDTKWQV